MQAESRRDELRAMSAKQLRAELTARGLPMDDLVEKADFVDRLLSAEEEEQREVELQAVKKLKQQKKKLLKKQKKQFKQFAAMNLENSSSSDDQQEGGEGGEVADLSRIVAAVGSAFDLLTNSEDENEVVGDEEDDEASVPPESAFQNKKKSKKTKKNKKKTGTKYDKDDFDLAEFQTYFPEPETTTPDQGTETCSSEDQVTSETAEHQQAQESLDPDTMKKLIESLAQKKSEAKAKSKVQKKDLFGCEDDLLKSFDKSTGRHVTTDYRKQGGDTGRTTHTAGEKKRIKP